MKFLSRKAILRSAQTMIWSGLAYSIAMLFAEKSWILETLSNGRMLVLLVVLLGSALCAIAFAPFKMLPGLIVATWLAWPALPYYGLGELAIFGKPERDPDIESSESSISVLSFNIGSENAPFPEFVENLTTTPRHEIPDLVLIIEPRNATYREHYNTLRQIYPHHIANPRDDNFGIWLMSKHPISKQRSVSRKDRTPIGEIPLIDADISVNGQTVRFLGAHPYPPLSKATANARAEYFSLIESRLAENPSPTILMGDLNCAKWSPQFKKLDALRPAAYGYGLRLTWKPFGPTPLLGLPIDHILVSNDLVVEDFSVGRANGSDHKPLRARISLPAPQ